MASEPDIVDAIRAVFDGAAEVLVASDYADACPIATVALEVASTDEELRQVTAAVFEDWLTSMTTRLLTEGIDETTSRELSILFVASLEGGFLLSRAAKDPAPMRTLGSQVAATVARALPGR